MTEALVLRWRATLQRATIEKRDAFEVLESLESDDFAYIDSPYPGHNDTGEQRMYAIEFSPKDFERLRDILHNACFPWMLSFNDHGGTWNDYLYDEQFSRVVIPYKNFNVSRSNTPKYFEWLLWNY